MLAMRVNPRTKRKEYALVSTDKKRVLRYFGKARPSDETLAREESRIEYFANKKGKA